MAHGANPAFRSRSLVRPRIGAFRASDAGSNPAGSIPTWVYSHIQPASARTQSSREFGREGLGPTSRASEARSLKSLSSRFVSEERPCPPRPHPQTTEASGRSFCANINGSKRTFCSSPNSSRCWTTRMHRTSSLARQEPHRLDSIAAHGLRHPLSGSCVAPSGIRTSKSFGRVTKTRTSGCTAACLTPDASLQMVDGRPSTRTSQFIRFKISKKRRLPNGLLTFLALSMTDLNWQDSGQ